MQKVKRPEVPSEEKEGVQTCVGNASSCILRSRFSSEHLNDIVKDFRIGDIVSKFSVIPSKIDTEKDIIPQYVPTLRQHFFQLMWRFFAL